jgi:sodium/pantothenate symporter
MTAWLLFGAYALATAWLAWRSGRGTDSASSFAVGSGRMHPVVAGITLGACLASSATFVIVPGFVHHDGLPALIGFTLPLWAGIATGLFLCAPAFQRHGKELGALTVPHWLGARYRSDSLRQLFSALNLLQVAYLALITIGAATVMQVALGVPYPAAVVGIVCFVFAYTGLGGATAHAWTNTLQGVVMCVVAVFLFLQGAPLWPAVVADLAQTGTTAPGSALFSTSPEVWVVPFVMGAALATQPHLLSKALYVQGRAELRTTLALGMGSFMVFSLVVVAGAYARLVLPQGELAQDQVMAQYLLAVLGDGPLASVVLVAILASAMSTLDGLLVAIAASVSNDLLPGRGSVAANRAVLLLLAVATIAIALHPPPLALVLGQLGVYGLVVASAGPLVAGLILQHPSRRAALVSAVAAGTVYAVLASVLPNPGLAGCGGLLVGLPIALLPARAGLRLPTPEVTG